jgi:hypothetical protein
MNFPGLNTIFMIGFFLFGFVSLGLGGMLAYLYARNPSIIKIALYNRIVWVVGVDGQIVPEKAELIDNMYRTKNGAYQFEREDVVHLDKTPGILVYSPYARAIRPVMSPILSGLKKLNIDRTDKVYGILDCKEMTPQEFEQYKEEVKANAANSSDE